VVTAARPRPAGLLAAPSPGQGYRVAGRWGQGDGGAGLGLAAEEVLLAEAERGAELFDLLFKEGLALDGAVVHGLPIAGLTPGLELLGEAGANGTGAVGDGRRGAGRVRWHGVQGNPRGVREARTSKRSGHEERCSPGPSTGQRS
jgi:hypothetical protein